MVSLLNNAGIRLCFSKDAQLPQYPYSYLPDNYQNHMNSPNLLYSQPPPEAEPKKTKTSKKKAENDKNARENSSLLECTKEDLIIWLNSLTLEERFEAFSIKNPWLAVAFVKMYKKWSESRDTIFRLLPEENPLNTDKSNASFGDFDNHFYFRSSVTGKMPHIIKIEEILIQNVRIYDDNNLYNMIAFKDDLLQDMDQVIKMFNIISNDKAFTKPCQSVSDHKNSTNVTVDKPTWFKPNEFATLAEWIVGSFEKAIWTKYLQNKKAPNKYSSAFEALDSKVTLSYKRSLVEFWTGLEKSKKKKIVSTANETFKWLNSPDSEQKSSDNGREINQGLRKLYEGPLFAQSKESTTAENINAYFTQLMEEKNDETVIETILMTSLFQFGTISNLICRKLAHKLRNMLSEKIASDLILNEEREKKNSTKKKSKKKKAKKPAQQNDAKDTNKADGSKAERIDCVGTTEEDDIQIEDITYEEEEKKPQINITKSVNNNPIPEKEAPKVNTLVGPVANNTKNKKNKQAKEKAKAAEEVKAVEVQDHKPEEKTEQLEEAKTETRKNSQIDPWQQFDEFDKKISKSQKRKLKKKQKNLEKEKLNGEEEPEKETETDKMEEEPIPEDNKENDNVVNKPREEKEAKENIVNIPETKNLQTKAPETTKEQKRDNRSNENKKKNNAERRNNDASVKNAESQSLPTTPLLSKTESITKNLQKEEPASAKIVPATQVDDSEFGFIEVKAKKKLEKEPPQKERRDREAKGAGRRKKQKEEAETKKPAKNTRRPKSPLPPTEMKKESSEIRSTKGTERSAPIVKCVVTEVTHKNNVGIPKVILGPAVSSKATTTKASKKEPVDEKLEGSSNSSEGEGTPCNTRNTSHTSRSSHNPQRSPNETNIDNTSEQKNANNNAKNHRGHPLSLASPSLDLETIKVAQAKDYANKYFNKKFENDVYKYVSSLTDEANKMTDYRIIAFRRLDHCITSLFPNFNVQTKIFGSCATGLALTSSDIDISVSGLEAYDRFALGDYLLLISNALNQFKWVTSNDPILTASVPILKLEIDLRAKFAEVKENQTPNKLFDIPMDNKDELNVDIPADRDDLKIRVDLSLESLGMGYNYHLGYKTTAFVQRMLGKYESLYIVTMVLKQFLFTRRLLNIYKGGVSSYCLVIMIVALLQKFGDEGYMTTLKRFFSYYGEVFKPETTGISLIDKDPFFPLGHSYETAPFWIIVDNNFNRKNIGGGVYSIKVILHEFANAFHTIETIRKKLEETAAKNHQLVQSIDDISKLELDQDIQTMLKSNLLELIINNSELISQGE